MLLPESQLKQAQALIQDIRQHMRELIADEYPIQDYRVIDIFRGLGLADKGLDAMIKGEHYTEYAALKKILEDMADFEFTDEEIRNGDGPRKEG